VLLQLNGIIKITLIFSLHTRIVYFFFFFYLFTRIQPRPCRNGNEKYVLPSPQRTSKIEHRRRGRVTGVKRTVNPCNRDLCIVYVRVLVLPFFHQSAGPLFARPRTARVRKPRARYCCVTFHASIDRLSKQSEIGEPIVPRTGVSSHTTTTRLYPVPARRFSKPHICVC
jgi:hypothetical protein